MTGDLVAFGNHTADESALGGAGDEVITPVLAVDEEGGDNTVGLEEVKESRGVDVWAIVES